MLLGGTVAEIQGRISANEFRKWCAYFRKHGRITPERKFDSVPILTWRVDRAVGGNLNLSDLLPHRSSAETNESDEVSAVLKEFGGVKLSG